MEDKDLSSVPEGLSDTLTSVLGNPEIMEKLSNILGTLPPKETSETATSDTASAMGNVLSDPALLAKLPEVISVLRPIVGDNEKKEDSHKKESPPSKDKRLALLCALKPYLSPGRCEAIDYFMRISKISDMIKNIKL